jgi:antitoxin (DNA-binding transcriptional repressor) of toxin-antitoxin stability system
MFRVLAKQPALSLPKVGFQDRFHLSSHARLQGWPQTPILPNPVCDAKMYHMKQASIRDLRYDFKKIERLLHQGEEVQITKRRRIIARLVPEGPEATTHLPDFMARLRTIYGDKVLAVSGAELLASDRSRD